jgi:hypothetical protein
MGQVFEISYGWTKREEPLCKTGWIDTEPVLNAFEVFLGVCQGEFEIRVDRYGIPLDLDPDLSTIFEYIPSILESLEKDTDAPVMFDFFEQGTEFEMWMERAGEFVKLWFVIIGGGGRTEMTVPQKHYGPRLEFLIPSHEFLGEWVRFTNAILKAMLELQPELEQEASYVRYSNRINGIASRVGRVD